MSCCLLQLVRARQCPYFYAVNNTFTGLFRAAGICGHSEVHAIVTPTTQGFRNLLKDEGMSNYDIKFLNKDIVLIIYLIQII